MTTKAWVLLADDQVIPVTNLFDAYGDEVDDPEMADRFVAGPMADGNWLSATVDEFPLASKH